MSTFLLLPGAGGDSWYWHRVAPLLRENGHEAIAPEMPTDDDDAGLDAYVATAVAAVDGNAPVVVVAQSMAGLYAALVAQRVAAERIVLVAPMIPSPGETGGDWWQQSGQVDAQRELDEREGRNPDLPFDPITTFMHDLPQHVLDEALARGAPDQSMRPFADAWPLEKWPDIPTRVIAGRNDRLFPLEFMRRLARERLGIEPEVIETGHLPALAEPDELVRMLLA